MAFNVGGRRDSDAAVLAQVKEAAKIHNRIVVIFQNQTLPSDAAQTASRCL